MRGLAIAVVAGVAIAVWSCTVNTKTDKLACTVQADCSGGRVCESGFCVIDPNAKLDAAIDIDAAVCPPACDSCDFPSGTCMITGTGGAVTCPASWHCNIVCTSTGACGAVTCTDAAACDLTCTGSGACQDLTCGDGRCTQICQGSGACGNTSCASSCKCDVTCSPVFGACGTMTCPVKANKNCTDSMIPGGACNSTVSPQCHSC